jgi:hypothetical protein
MEQKIKPSQFSSILFFFVATTVLFLGFYRNQWSVVTLAKFNNFQFDDQSLVMGRLVESRQNGIFSHGGLLGRGDFNLYRADDGTYNYQKIYERQYDAYLKKQTFSEYGRYGSQSGMQAMFFGALDKLSPFTPVENMRIYRVITSLTFALVIGYLLFWFLTEF